MQVTPPLLLLPLLHKEQLEQQHEVQQPVTMWLEVLQGAVESRSALCWLTARLNFTLQVNNLRIFAQYS